MKIKTSVTLSANVLKAIDKRARQLRLTRSRFIERAIETVIAQLHRKELNARDLARINRRADQLNREAEDVLEYQGTL
jgi:metal-responsive CopG/Arc/MetJ family transcriptional regulator